MFLVRRCPTASTAARRPIVLCCLASHSSSEPSSKEKRHAESHPKAIANRELPLEVFSQHIRHQHQQQQRLKEPQQRQQNRPSQNERQELHPPPPLVQPALENSPSSDETTTTTTTSDSSSRHGLALLMSAFREVSLARRDLGWGVDEMAMRLTMLGFLRHGRNNSCASDIPEEATLIDGKKDWLADRTSEWERFLGWAHASYGWSEEVVVKRAGFAPGELEVVALSRGKSRNRPMAPTYVLAVDHGRKEIVLSVRGTKAFGDAITITHFRPEPFLSGYAHRGFAQCAHELVKQVEPQLASLAERLPDYSVCFTGHSMGGGIAAMASMLIRDGSSRWHRHQRNEQQRQQQPNQQAAEAPPTPPTESPPVLGKRSSGGGGGDGGGGGSDFGHLRSGEERERAADETVVTSGLPGREFGLGSPKVYSFATPSCVSLELARGCEGWVDSIVHGDDAIPRLSTVSLELLKEDMTAAEWRRAVDRLTHLNTILSPSTKAAAAAAAAIKNALTGFGALRRSQPPPGAGGSGSSDDGRTRQAAGGDNFGGRSSGDDAEFSSSNEGRRKETAAPPSGPEPISAATATALGAKPKVARRREAGTGIPAPASVATGPARTPSGTGLRGEPIVPSGGGEGDCGEEEADHRTIEDEKRRDDLGRSVRDTVLTMRGLAKLYPLSQSFRQEIASIVAQVVKLTGGDTADGIVGAIKNQTSQTSRAANNNNGSDSNSERRHQLRRQPGGSGTSASSCSGSSGGRPRPTSGNTNTTDGEGCHSDGSTTAVGGGAWAEPEPSSSSVPDLLLTLTENLESLGASRAALNCDTPTLGGGSGGGGGDTNGGGLGCDKRTGVPRQCSVGGAPLPAAPGAAGAESCGRDFAAATAAAANRAADAAVSTGTESARECESTSAGPTAAATTATVTSKSGDGARVGASDPLRCLHESYSARPEPSLLPLYPPGDAFLVYNTRNNSTSTSTTNTHQASGQATHAPQTTATGTSGTPSAAAEGGFVLLRVPHEHFLRMPLSRSMLEDHSIASYRRALTGLCTNVPPGREGPS